MVVVADPLTATSVAIGAALLGVQVLREARDADKQAIAAPAQSAPPAFMPQTRPGDADQGGPQVVYALPPGMTPRDVANLYAAQGRPHDAAPVINIYQGGTTVVPLTPDTSGTRTEGTGETPNGQGDKPADTTPAQTTTTPASGGAPQGGAAATDPTNPGAAPGAGPGPAPVTHQDVWGRTREGPPSAAETSLKDALPWIGSAALIETGTARLVTAPASAAGPVGIGLGLGLMATQTLQQTGVFDNVVKPAGASASEAMGPTASRAVATALLPLTVPGGAVKALVTPGESVAGNVGTALSKSYLPEAVIRTHTAAQGAAQNVAQAANAVKGDVWSGLSSVSRFGSTLGGKLDLPTVAQAVTPAPVSAVTTAAAKAAPAVAQAVASNAQAAGAALAGGAKNAGGAVVAAAGAAGHKLNQGGAALKSWAKGWW